MSTLSMKLNVSARLLTISVISLTAVIYCFYLATRREADFTSGTPAVTRLRPVEDDRPAPPCSFQTFRDIARQRADGYIPGTGTWTRNGTRMERFQPSVCRLKHGKWIPEEELVACLRRDRVRYIAIIGDSNGRGYLFNLYRMLDKAPVNTTAWRRITCGPIYRHVELKYKSYRLPEVLVKHRCPCGGYCTLEFTESMRSVHCDVRQVRCAIDDDTDVVLEYVTAWFTIDRKVQVCRRI